MGSIYGDRQPTNPDKMAKAIAIGVGVGLLFMLFFLFVIAPNAGANL